MEKYNIHSVFFHSLCWTLVKSTAGDEKANIPKKEVFASLWLISNVSWWNKALSKKHELQTGTQVTCLNVSVY